MESRKEKRYLTRLEFLPEIKSPKGARLKHQASTPKLPLLRSPVQSVSNSPKSLNNLADSALRFSLLEPLPPISIKSKYKDRFTLSPIKVQAIADTLNCSIDFFARAD